MRRKSNFLKILEKLKYGFLLGIVLLGSCAKPTKPLEEVQVSWRPLQNNYQESGRFLSEFVIENQGQEVINDNWEFYFNFIYEIRTDENQPMSFARVNGDFQRMKPDVGFTLKPGEKVSVQISCAGGITSHTDMPSGAFFVDLKATDAPIALKGDVALLDFDRSKISKRIADDKLPIETASVRFDHHQSYNLSKVQEHELLPVVPEPYRYELGAGMFQLEAGTAFAFDDIFEGEAKFLASTLRDIADLELNQVALEEGQEEGLLIKYVQGYEAEAYKLDITGKGIKVEASTAAGAFYGVQTINSLLMQAATNSEGEGLRLQCMTIEDKPRFAYRGIHLDVSRNFMSKESVLKLLDLMGMYKLNKFHFHFCDDEGWRIEIPSLPELTEVGSKRPYKHNDANAMMPSFGSGPFAEGSKGSGYYSREEFIEILKFATKRHIEVIPEIDMPGHARAAIVSMNARHDRLMSEGKEEEAKEFLLSDPNDKSVYQSVQGWNDNVVNVCMEGTYRFVDEVTKQLVMMFEEAGAPLTTIHSGGDEVPEGVWQGSKYCTDFIAANDEYNDVYNLHLYFSTRFHEIMDKYGLNTAGWEEIVLRHTDDGKEPVQAMAGKNFIPYAWNAVLGFGQEDLPNRLANAGFPIVACNVSSLYLDMAYAYNFDEPGQSWGGFTDTRTYYEYTPLDIRHCSYQDFYGNKLDGYKAFEGKTTLTEEGKKNIIGMQGLLWSENTRSPEMMEYMVFPKLLGLSQRAWSKQPEWSKIRNEEARLKALNADWNVFANTLGQQELPKLDKYQGGLGYRIPPPGGKLIDGELHLSIEFPGLEMRYTVDGSEPTETSPLYEKPVKLEGPVKAKAFDTNGRSSRLVTIV